MKFNEQVTQLTDKPPEGWEAKLFPDEYAELDSERKVYYSAVYAKYRTKKYRAYGEYGEFEGWQPMQVGVGKPIGYRYHGVIIARAVDSVLKSNVLMTRILASDPKQGGEIRWS